MTPPFPNKSALSEAAAYQEPLAPSRLYTFADLSGQAFKTTSEVTPAKGMAVQNRARDAISLAARMQSPGFNLFVTGPPGGGMREAVKAALRDAAYARPSPPDWVYVYNFADPSRPAVIDLPSGRAMEFRDAMRDLIAELKIALPAAFEQEDYQTRRTAIDEAVHQRQVEAFSELGDKAGKQNVVVVRTPLGFALAPSRNGQVIAPDEFNSLPEAQRRQVQEEIHLLEKDLEHILRQMPLWEKERRNQLRQLDRETTKLAVGQSLEEIQRQFSDIPKVREHLSRAQDDLIENSRMFIANGMNEQRTAEDHSVGGLFDRYEVNVVVGRSPSEKGCPVIEEMHPTLVNLIGRVEYAARQGVLHTSFRLIKGGSLHHANGGYLILDARALLSEPFSWSALKRALRQQEITIEDVSHFMGLTGTISLEPDRIPLDLKIVLVGERLLYYLLAEFDPEFHEHFKILADFDDDIDRFEKNEAMFAQLVATMVQESGLKAVTRDGVERIIEHAARLSDAANKLTLVGDNVRDILIEADFWATTAEHEALTRDDVQRALDERDRRAARLRERAQESILHDVMLVDTEGTSIGQVNGLSVIELGRFRFGRPTRITARVRPGTGRVVDIEREVALGGPLHSKGVLILSGFLSGRYALDTPMSLFASLVFEQSYGGVEGDSASSAELYALLSALSEIPLRQDLAVTGSVNQHGQVQAIGGVNEKVEGFFDICRARGFTGSQGVIIPRSNVQHLMLRSDVVQACADAKFALYAVTSIDQGLELLTGITAGVRDGSGMFSPSSVNRAVEERLQSFAAIRRQFSGTGETAPNSTPWVPSRTDA